MLRRLRMIFRSLFGWMIRGAEDPEMLLRQYAEDLRDQIPRMNEQAAQIIKLEKMLEQQAERQRAVVVDLQGKVEAAVKMGEGAKDAALSLIEALENAKKELADTEAQLEQARENSQKTLQMRQAYERRIKEKINEAMRQVSRAKRAQMEQQMASLMTSFQVGDSTDTLERMTERIDERLAEARARSDVASHTVDAKMAEIEIAAQRSQAENLYEEYQRQFGLVEATDAPEKTMDAIPLQEQDDSGEQRPDTRQTQQQ